MSEAGPLLVTGASGLLGANVVLAARERGHAVVALSHQHTLASPGVRSLRLDLRQEAAIDGLGDLRPGWIFHCAAATDVERCEDHQAECHDLNADATRRLARWARRAGAGFIYVSTDAVFDGRRGGYREDDATAPLNAYARSKLAGERAALEELPDRTMIVRTSIYGWNAQAKESIGEWFLHRLEAGTPVPGFADAIFSPIVAGDLADIVLDMAHRGLFGVYHVAGSDAITKYEFGVRVAEVFGLDPQLVRRAAVREAGLRAPRGRDLSLSVDKVARALGRAMPGVDAGLRRFARERGDGTLERLKGLGGADAGA